MSILHSKARLEPVATAQVVETKPLAADTGFQDLTFKLPSVTTLLELTDQETQFLQMIGRCVAAFDISVSAYDSTREGTDVIATVTDSRLSGPMRAAFFVEHFDVIYGATLQIAKKFAEIDQQLIQRYGKWGKETLDSKRAQHFQMLKGIAPSELATDLLELKQMITGYAVNLKSQKTDSTASMVICNDSTPL